MEIQSLAQTTELSRGLPIVGLVFGLWSIRYAKIIWLNIDLTFHPPSREDFEQRGRNESKV